MKVSDAETGGFRLAGCRSGARVQLVPLGAADGAVRVRALASVRWMPGSLPRDQHAVRAPDPACRGRRIDAFVSRCAWVGGVVRVDFWYQSGIGHLSGTNLLVCATWVPRS